MRTGDIAFVLVIASLVTATDWSLVTDPAMMVQRMMTSQTELPLDKTVSEVDETDSSFATGLDTVAKRLAAAQNAPELDKIVSGTEEERRAAVAKLVDVLRSSSPDAVKVRACYLGGALGDSTVVGTLLQNIDIGYIGSALDDHKINTRRLGPAPCADALLQFGRAITGDLVRVAEESENPCRREEALSLLLVLHESEGNSLVAAQAEVEEVLRRAKARAQAGEAVRLQTAMDAWSSGAWSVICSQRVVRDDSLQDGPHLRVTDMGATAGRLREARSPIELDGIMNGVEDARLDLVKSLRHLIDSASTPAVRARACYLLGQFHASASQELMDNVDLEWIGGLERYPCREALVKAWASGPPWVMNALAATDDPAKRGRLVGILVTWWGSDGAAARLVKWKDRARDSMTAGRLGAALAVAQAVAGPTGGTGN